MSQIDIGISEKDRIENVTKPELRELHLLFEEHYPELVVDEKEFALLASMRQEPTEYFLNLVQS